MNTRSNCAGGPQWPYISDGKDTFAYHGDSGGPLLDSQGRIVGIMSLAIPDFGKHSVTTVYTPLFEKSNQAFLKSFF